MQDSEIDTQDYLEEAEFVSACCGYSVFSEYYNMPNSNELFGRCSSCMENSDFIKSEEN